MFFVAYGPNQLQILSLKLASLNCRSPSAQRKDFVRDNCSVVFYVDGYSYGFSCYSSQNYLYCFRTYVVTKVARQRGPQARSQRPA